MMDPKKWTGRLRGRLVLQRSCWVMSLLGHQGLSFRTNVCCAVHRYYCHKQQVKGLPSGLMFLWVYRCDWCLGAAAFAEPVHPVCRQDWWEPCQLPKCTEGTSFCLQPMSWVGPVVSRNTHNFLTWLFYTHHISFIKAAERTKCEEDQSPQLTLKSFLNCIQQ